MSNFYFKTKKRMIAWICAITMVVAGLTVVPKTVAADDAETDYSGLEFVKIDDVYSYAQGEKYVLSSVSADANQIKFNIAVAAGEYPVWPDFSDATLNGEETSVAAGATISINKSDLKEGYNVYKVKSCDVGSYVNRYFSIIVKKGSGSTGGETTTPGVTKPNAPTNLVANINDLKTNFTIAFDASKTNAKSYNLYIDNDLKRENINNGFVLDFKEFGLEEGKTYSIGVSSVNDAGESDKAIIEKEVPVTEDINNKAPEMSPGVLIEIIKDRQALRIAGLNNILYATTYKLYQDGVELRNVGNGEEIPLSQLEPGEHEYYIIGVNDNGSSEPSAKFNIVIPETKASKNIIVDNGAAKAVEEDSEYTFGNAKYGYYELNKKVIYKAGSTIKVKDNMHLVSINDIKLSFTNGAAIRIDAGVTTTPGGIRFQAKLDVTCGVDAYKNEIINALQAGTMITTKDILEKSGKEYTVENIKEIGTVLNVENKNGWKDEATHTFNASLINIVEANYTRYFVAKAYVKVPYANDVPAEYVYSENDANSAVQVERSISDIAKTISNNGYDGIENENIKSLINSFIKK